MPPAIQTDFDPYHKWLGIRDPKRPLNFYRLLGLELFEDDPEVIRGAAARHISHVRTFRFGKFEDSAKDLLDELSEARDTLLDEDKKLRYDRVLRQQTNGSSSPAKNTPAPASLQRAAKEIDCPHCAWENSGDRQFCAGCGVALWEKCVACEAVNATSEKHCGSCGANLAGSVGERGAQLEQQIRDAQSLAEQNRYTDALALLDQVAKADHPRLKHFSQQAQDIQAKLRAAAEQWQRRCDEMLTQAQQLFAARDDENAAQLLETVPEALRTDEILKLIDAARGRQIEALSLAAEIRRKLAAKETDDLLPRVERLLELRPDNSQAADLAQKLRVRQLKGQESLRFKLLTAAKDKLQQHEYAAAVTLLERVPLPVRDENYDKFWTVAEAKAGEVAWLTADLRDAVCYDEHLLPVAERLLKLRPNDQQAARFVAVLRKWVQQGPPAQTAALKWPQAPEKTALGFPVATFDEFQRIDCGTVRAASEFAQGPDRFAVAFGLALQGLGQAPVTVNFLPEEKSVLSLLKRAVSKRTPKTVWGIDVGRRALKAARLSYDAEQNKAAVEAVELVEYPVGQARTDAEHGELVKQALATFLERQPIKDQPVCVSFTGERALSRFFTLPMLDRKKIPEVIRYEAKQQVPFPLETVVWCHHVLEDQEPAEEGSLRECEVALFALKVEDAQRQAALFTDAGLTLDLLQSDTIALFNALAYDRFGAGSSQPAPPSPDKPTEMQAMLDIGVESSRLLVTNGRSLWYRGIPQGGNHFTRAIVKNLGITYEQAHRLKRQPTLAPSLSKLYKAMEPAFTNLFDELQRTIEYYHSLDRTRQITRLTVTGGGRRLHGLLRFLQHGR